MDIEGGGEDKRATLTSSPTPDGVFEALVKKENLDILCIQAKHAFIKYDIQAAGRLSKE